MGVKQKICKQCKAPFPAASRIDKLFCSDKCRSDFHNQQRYNERTEIEAIDSVLKKNRRILKNMFERADHYKIKKDKLLLAGFLFDYHTHHVITKIEKNEFLFCYDYGYREIHPGVYKIVEAFRDEEGNKAD